jgi:hypothetical protein
MREKKYQRNLRKIEMVLESRGIFKICVNLVATIIDFENYIVPELKR